MFERNAAVAGLAYVVLTFVGVLMYPNVQPPYEETAVRAAYGADAARAAWSAVLQLLAIIPFSVFLVGLWARIRRTDDHLAMIVLLGGFATMVVIHVWQAVLVGITVMSISVEAGSDLRPILAVISGIDQSVTLPLAIMTGAAGVAMLAGRDLPRWLGWLGIATAGVAIAGVMAILVVVTDPQLGRALAAANPLALLLFLVWVVGVCIVFLRSPRGVN